jgi:hypothetical protein
MVAIMFTVEMDTDNGESVTITTLDGTGKYDDVRLVMFDDVVFLSQQDDHDMMHSLILSPQQWHDLTVAMKTTEGAYILQPEERN